MLCWQFLATVLLLLLIISSLYRQIWSCLRINPRAHHCCFVLSFLCLCWYVQLIHHVNKQTCGRLIHFVIRFVIWYIPFHHASTGAGGLSFLQFCNLNSFRTKFILGFSIFMGLSVPQYFNEYTAIKGYGPVHSGGRWVCSKHQTRCCFDWIM